MTRSTPTPTQAPRPMTRDRRLLAATGVILFSVAAAIGLLDGVLESGDLAAYDPAVSAAAVELRSPALTGLARTLTFLGSSTALVPLTLLLVGGLLLSRRWWTAVVVATGMSASLLLTIAVKGLVGRDRPPAVDLLGPKSTGYAFPSGHTLNSTVFAGLVAGLLLIWLRRTWARVVAVVGCAATAVGVGLSRVYLGYHWLTDVMAGWSLALAVLGALLMATVLATRDR